MRIPAIILELSVVLLMWGCSGRAGTDCISGYGTSLTWEFLGNDVSRNVSVSEFTIKNTGNKILEDDNWKLYFNQMGTGYINESLDEKVAFDHINGDLVALYPTAGFRLGPGAQVKIRYEKRGMILKEVEAPAAPYLEIHCIAEDNRPAMAPDHYNVLPFPPLEKVYPPETGIPLPDAAWVFGRNEGLRLLEKKSAPGIVPAPEKLNYRKGSVLIEGSWTISSAGKLENEAGYLAGMLEDLLGKRLAVVAGGRSGRGIISLELEQADGSGHEDYSLDVTDAEGIRIRATSPAGIFYGIQSLLSLVPSECWGSVHSSVKIKSVNIIDSPAFQYRGIMLDVARNFHGMHAVKKLLDIMAHYKLNRLHLSLTNDEGWRIEIPEFPELTDIGGFRGHSLTGKDFLLPAYGSGHTADASSGLGSGFYTREQFVELLT